MACWPGVRVILPPRVVRVWKELLLTTSLPSIQRALPSSLAVKKEKRPSGLPLSMSGVMLRKPVQWPTMLSLPTVVTAPAEVRYWLKGVSALWVRLLTAPRLAGSPGSRAAGGGVGAAAGGVGGGEVGKG